MQTHIALWKLNQPAKALKNISQNSGSSPSPLHFLYCWGQGGFVLITKEKCKKKQSFFLRAHYLLLFLCLERKPKYLSRFFNEDLADLKW